MREIIAKILQVPKWYGIGVILLYSLLVAEFFSSINKLFIQTELVNNDILIIFSRISYVVMILSGVIVWIISTFLFHLTALLFDGKSSFGRFLFVSSYPYLIPVIMIFVGLFLLDEIQIPNSEDTMAFLKDNQTFKLSTTLINYSFIPYYLIIVVLIRYIHQIKYIYALLSVIIPVLSIWLITMLFKLI